MAMFWNGEWTDAKRIEIASATFLILYKKI